MVKTNFLFWCVFVEFSPQGFRKRPAAIGTRVVVKVTTMIITKTKVIGTIIITARRAVILIIMRTRITNTVGISLDEAKNHLVPVLDRVSSPRIRYKQRFLTKYCFYVIKENYLENLCFYLENKVKWVKIPLDTKTIFCEVSLPVPHFEFHGFAQSKNRAFVFFFRSRTIASPLPVS